MEVGRNGIKKVYYLRIVIPAELKTSHFVLKLLCLMNRWEEFGLGLLILHGGLMRDLCKVARVGVPGWVFAQRPMSAFLLRWWVWTWLTFRKV